jgi:anti-sigma regulatory factor (Ser/Thr protein kinase)
VIYRHHQTPLLIESDATADQLVRVRHRLAAWLRAAHITDEPAADIVLVVSEACTNCVEHAYRGFVAGTMVVEVSLGDGEVRARITDYGSWKTPAPKPVNGGRGLPLIRALSHSTELETAATGTTVDITFRLPTESD